MHDHSMVVSSYQILQILHAIPWIWSEAITVVDLLSFAQETVISHLWAKREWFITGNVCYKSSVIAINLTPSTFREQSKWYLNFCLCLTCFVDVCRKLAHYHIKCVGNYIRCFFLRLQFWFTVVPWLKKINGLIFIC